MAKVPQYEQRTQVQGGGPLGLVSPPQNMHDGIGRGLHNLGSGIQKWAEDESMADANRRAALINRDMRERLNQVMTAPASEFESAVEDFRREFDRRASEDAKHVRLPAARSFFQRSNDRLSTEFADQIQAKRYDAHLMRFSEGLEESLAADSAAVQADPDAADRILDRQREAIAKSGLQIDAQEKMQAHARRTIAVATVRGEMRRDPRRLIEELKKPEPEGALALLTSQQRQAALVDAQREFTEQRIGGLVEGISAAFARGISQGDAALSRLPAELSDAEQAQVRQQVRARVGLLQDERSRLYAKDVAPIVLRIKAGLATPKDLREIDRYRELGAVTDGQREHYASEYQEQARRAAERDAGARDVAALLRAGLPLDPTSSEHRKALAGAFETAIGAIPVTDERAFATGLGFAKRTRMLPAQLSSWLNSAARSPDMAVATKAAEYATILQRQAPEAFGELNQDTRAFLATVGDMMTAGATRESAFQTARATIYETPSAVLELRKAELPALEKALPGALNGFIDRDFDPGLFAAQPAATQRLQADFLRQSRLYFLKTGNAQIAQELAWGDLRRVYGSTSVNGAAELQPFPIESYGVKPDQVRASVAKFLEANPHEGVTTDGVRVVADELTLSMVSDALTGKPVRPSWALVGDHGDVLLNADGTRARLALPSPERLREQIEAERMKANADELAKARKDREANQAMQRQLAEQFMPPPGTATPF